MTVGAQGTGLSMQRPLPAIFAPRPPAVWFVIGSLILFCIFSVGLFFEAVAPVAPFRVQPNVAADASTYWMLSGVNQSESEFSNHTDTDKTVADYGNNTLGPIGQARIFRTEFGVMLCNFGLLILVLWIVGTMPEFDRGMFTLLLLLNPLLISAVISLNKEIFAIAGMILFVKYLRTDRYRKILLFFAVFFSLAARWQQAAVMLMLACFEARISPVRGKPRAGLMIAVLFFAAGYTAIYQLAPDLIAGLLAQAQAGHTIVILDNIQGRFGLPLVLIPKVLFNVMGRFVTPSYFIEKYWEEDFTDWHAQIFLQIHEVLITALLLFLFFSRRLPLKDPAVYLLYLYLILTAVNPMVNPRYEYPAYVLLCLQASKFFKLRSVPKFPQVALPGT